MKKLFLAGLLSIITVLSPMFAGDSSKLGCVDTTFNLLTPNDKVCIFAFEDPSVKGVTCHLSRAVKGGIGGALGIAEDTSDASIACRQTGPITISTNLPDGQEVFTAKTSFLFKSMDVRRFYDKEHNTLIYLVTSTKVVDGSAKNSVSTVPVRPW